MRRDDKHVPSRRQYPPFFEKAIPIALVIIALIIVVLLLVIAAVILGLLPGLQ